MEVWRNAVGTTYTLTIGPNLTAVESFPKITYGQVVEGSLAQVGETDVYLLEGRAGDHMRIVLNSLEVPQAGSVQMRLLDPEGKQVASQWTSAFGASIFNSLGFKDVVLSQDGVYWLLVEVWRNAVGTTYTLTVERIT